MRLRVSVACGPVHSEGFVLQEVRMHAYVMCERIAVGSALGFAWANLVVAILSDDDDNLSLPCCAPFPPILCIHTPCCVFLGSRASVGTILHRSRLGRSAGGAAGGAGHNSWRGGGKRGRGS